MAESNPSCRIDTVSQFCDFRATVDVLRLDLVHPVVSGNKWFKLTPYLDEAEQRGKVVLTFGGAFSNHIVATAAATASRGLQSIGIIRGERPDVLSHTLQQATSFGMKIFFTAREAYKKKIIPPEVFETRKTEDLFIVPEGGYGAMGMEGAKQIMRAADTSSYTHIVSAVGTGTTIAGLIAAANESQKVIGISVLKNAFSLEKEITDLLPEGAKNKINLYHDYHFGGYAIKTKELISFMNEFFKRTGIATDFVYTAKAFYAAFDLVRSGYFSANDKILLVHTGGLQGNRSLQNDLLVF